MDAQPAAQISQKRVGNGPGHAMGPWTRPQIAQNDVHGDGLGGAIGAHLRSLGRIPMGFLARFRG